MQSFVVYENPSDYPDKFVVRRWWGLKPKVDPEAVVSTLEAARAVIPEGLVCLERTPHDDPVIVEVWL